MTQVVVAEEPDDLAALQRDLAYPVRYGATRTGILFSNAERHLNLPQAHIRRRTIVRAPVQRDCP